MMSILKTKSAPVGQLYALRDPVGTPDGTMMPACYDVFGDPPHVSQALKILQPYGERFDGPRPFDVRRLDARKFIEAFVKAAQKPAAEVKRPTQLTRGELERQNKWPAGTIEAAQAALNFPRACGFRATRKGQEPLYSVTQATRWLEEFKSIAQMMGVIR